MLDIKRIRENPDELLRAMQSRRFTGVDMAAFLETDAKRRGLVTEVEALKARRNEVNERISAFKREGKDAQHLMADMKEAGAAIKAMDAQIRKLDEEMQDTLLRIPNIPHGSTPVGGDENANIELRRHGEPARFAFEPKPHWELGEALDVLDFAMGGKVTGARFTFYKGLGARLERAVINFFLDIHSCENGYTEVFPPFLANAASMTGTGQLPKFAEDMFKVEGTDYYLVPTAEVPVTNMYRDSILQAAQLPIRHCAYSACFRAEAGSAGRDTRGLIRQHQFNKVELVKFTAPEASYEELEALTKDAELVLQRLGLPYRVVALSTGDLGFSAAKTYDLEVWMPSYGRYLEISSCSNFEDFQARRANIRFRREKKAKPEYVHTLNGSGLAVGRTVAAILENYQQPDGSVKIPKVLVPYMGANIIERG